MSLNSIAAMSPPALLYEIIQFPNQKLIRDHLTMGRCVLLTEAASCYQSGNARRFLEDLDRSRQNFPAFVQSLQTWVPVSRNGRSESRLVLDCSPQFLARFDLICGILGSDKVDLPAAVDAVVQSVTTDWHYQPSTATKEREIQCAGSHWKPSFFPLVDSHLGIPSRLEELLLEAADRHGHCHPGVLLIGEIMAEVLGCRKSAELSISSKIMFKGSQQGVLATVHLEQVPNGCGLLLPDPYYCGNLHMNRQFSAALQDAWHAAVDYSSAHFVQKTGKMIPPAFDWRWRIDLLQATKENAKNLPRAAIARLPLQENLIGNSTGVAFACSLIACDSRNPDNDGGINPLDANVGVTAALAGPTKTGEWITDGVNDVKIKTLVGRLEAERIQEIVVSDRQDPDELPDPGSDQRFEYLEANTLDQSYELMTRYPRITRGLNRYLAKSATEHLDRLCPKTIEEKEEEESGGYIEPEIVEIWKQESNAELGLGEQWNLRSAETPVRFLSAEAFQELVSGSWMPNDNSLEVPTRGPKLRPVFDPPHWASKRVRVFADSGLGKSSFILFCQQNIAQSKANLLPVRLGRTTGQDAALNIRWNEGTFENIIQKLSQLPGLSEAWEVLQRELADRTSIDQVTWWEYFFSMAKKGRIVFLIDALDQAQESVVGLGTFLGSKDVRSCRAILTGRLESYQTCQEAFTDNNHWHTLRIEPFDGGRQMDYLGPDLALKFFGYKRHRHTILNRHGQLETRIVYAQAKRGKLDRPELKTLLGIPLFLGLLKRLAARSPDENKRDLFDINSRHEFYDLAVDVLIGQGWKTASPDQRNRLVKKDSIRRLLGKIAWFMVWRPAPLGTSEESVHDFTNLLYGPRLNELLIAISNDIGQANQTLNSLEQIDIATANQIFEQAGTTGIAFRHRSFLEFFTAEYLMSDRDPMVDEHTGQARIKRTIPEQLSDQLLSEIHCPMDVDAGHKNFEYRRQRQNDWEQTLRFALANPDQQKRNELACSLITLGNARAVYDSIIFDQIEFEHDVDSLTRWLIHRSTRESYFRPVENCDRSHQELQKLALHVIEAGKVKLGRMLDRRNRNGSYISPLRQLIGDQEYYETISADSALVEQMTCLSQTDRRGQEIGSWNFLDSFYSVKGGHYPVNQYYTDQYSVSWEPTDVYDDGPRRPIEHYPKLELTEEPIEDFELADFPVTWGHFELFSPSHAIQRQQMTSSDEPVTRVNLWMAREFCDWLSAITKQTYRIPDEWEWEWACRWQNSLQENYWWGNKWETGRFRPWRQRSRGQALADFSLRTERAHPSRNAKPNSYGLLDLIGNVAEICPARRDSAEQNFRNGVATRDFNVPVRGGCVDIAYDGNNANLIYDALRISERRFTKACLNTFLVGFRVCRIP